MNICTVLNVLMALSQTHMDTPANQVAIAQVVEYTRQECAKIEKKAPVKAEKPSASDK